MAAASRPHRTTRLVAPYRLSQSSRGRRNKMPLIARYHSSRDKMLKRALSTGPGFGSGTSTMLFGFLLVFAALFVIIVISVLVLRQVYRRRRALAAAGMAEPQADGATQRFKSVPEIADVVVIDEKWDSERRRWGDIQPLAIMDLAGERRDEPRNSTADLVVSQAPSRRYRYRLPFLPRSAVEKQVASVPQRAAFENVQISFIVAMPSPPRQTYARNRPSSKQGHNWAEKELAIGTHIVRFTRADV